MKSRVFELSSFLSTNDVFHIARVNITSSNDLLCHSHNYAELFWVEKGEGFHFVNNQKYEISQGDLLMIRPNDNHTFLVLPQKELTIINVAFDENTLNYFKRRYFPNSNLYFWSTNILPFKLKLSSELLILLRQRTEETIKYERSNLQLDSLLLFIFRLISCNEMIKNSEATPDWLLKAINKYNAPSYFKQGTKGFCDLCERNVDYVNRVVNNLFGVTLTSLINSYRMKYSANQLSITSMPIKEISLNCGFNNLGHFYKLFFEYYGVTPSKYRKTKQLII